jgi:hypothetical protein
LGVSKVYWESLKLPRKTRMRGNGGDKTIEDTNSCASMGGLSRAVKVLSDSLSSRSELAR